MQKVNITLNVPSSKLTALEDFLNDNFELLDFSIIPDTSELYKTDATFKKLSDAVKKARQERDKYRLTK